MSTYLHFFSQFINLNLSLSSSFGEHFRAVLKELTYLNQEYHGFFWCVAIRQAHLITKKKDSVDTCPKKMP